MKGKMDADKNMPSDKYVAENTSKCSSCPPSCLQVIYDATVSGSMLSDMFIHTLMTRCFWSQIRDRYLDAIDVHSRVETESMVTMRQLVDLERTYETLSDVINEKLLNPSTSIVGDIYNAVDGIVQLTHDSVHRFHTQLLQPFTDTHEKKVDFFVRRIVNQANEFLAHHASNNNGSFTVASAMAFCQYFHEFVEWFKTKHDDPFKAWTYLDAKICNHDLWGMCRTFPTTEIDPQIPEQMKIWIKCMTEFREFLDDVASWLKTQATLNSSLPLRSVSYDGTLAKLRNNTKHLEQTAANYRLHKITKVWTNWIESNVVL